MKKTAIAAVVLTAISMPAMAGKYRFEVGAAVSTIDVGDLETDLASIDGTFYFDGGVDDSKGPLSEAAFMSKASSVFLSVLTSDSDLDGDPDNFSADSDGYSVGGKWVFSKSNFYLGLAYSAIDLSEGDDATPTDTDSDVDGYSLTFGKYFTDNLTLELTAGSLENDENDNNPSTSYKTEVDTFGVNMHYLFNPMEESDVVTMAFDLGWNRMETDITDVYSGMQSKTNSGVNIVSVGATLYPTRKLGLSLGWDAAGGDVSYDTFSFSAEYFIIPAIAINAGVSHTSVVDENAEATDLATIGIIGRF